MDIEASARKHGVSDDDMLHAYRHPIRVFDLDREMVARQKRESGRVLGCLFGNLALELAASEPLASARIASIAEMVARNHPEKPELIAEVQALAAQYEQAVILRGVGQ